MPPKIRNCENTPSKSKPPRAIEARLKPPLSRHWWGILLKKRPSARDQRTNNCLITVIVTWRSSNGQRQRKLRIPKAWLSQTSSTNRSKHLTWHQVHFYSTQGCKRMAQRRILDSSMPRCKWWPRLPRTSLDTTIMSKPCLSRCRWCRRWELI